MTIFDIPLVESFQSGQHHFSDSIILLCTTLNLLILIDYLKIF
jgi:hypothetical protein